MTELGIAVMILSVVVFLLELLELDTARQVRDLSKRVVELEKRR